MRKDWAIGRKLPNPNPEKTEVKTEDQEKIDKSNSSLDLLKKGGGGMPPEIDYNKIAAMNREATREILKELQEPQREVERIKEAVKEEVPKVVGTEVEQRIEKLKTSLTEEVKGLSKDEAIQLIDERMKELMKTECEDPNSLSCKMAKETAKTVVDEVLESREEKKPFEMPKVTPEYDEEWKKLTPEQRKALELIPKGDHPTMLEIILESPESHDGLNRRILERLSDEEMRAIVNQKPELAIKVAKAMCGANEECKAGYNKAIEESSEIPPKEKPHWLLK